MLKFKRFFGVFLAMALVLTLIASFAVFRSAPATASAHSAVASVIDHQTHVHLIPHKVGPGTVSFTMEGVGLTPHDTYILLDGLVVPLCSGVDTQALAIKSDGTGFLSKLVTAGGCRAGFAQVELVDAENQHEFWYAILSIG